MQEPNLEPLPGVSLMDLLRAARPFDETVIQSPWHPVVDTGLYKSVKDHLLHLVRECGRVGNHSRCATVIAPPGYGKTHLFAWLRQNLQDGRSGLFVYVPAVQLSGLTLEQHVVRAAFDSLFFHSQTQRAVVVEAIRSRLAKYYDEAISRRNLKLLDLGITQTWLGFFNRRSYHLRRQTKEEQARSLQRALTHRRFLQHAFDHFSHEFPPTGNATRADFHTFAACCYLACGDADQQGVATRWFQNDEIPVEEQTAHHLSVACEGEEKMRNSLFTLRSLAGRFLCLAYDQLEDSYRAFTEAGKWEEFRNRMGWVVNTLSVLPGIAQIFGFEQAVYEGPFRRQAPGFLIDRMTADGGELRLPPLRDDAAREVIRSRMEAAVWSKHPAQRPEDPLHPFTTEEITQLRRESDGEPRDFLNRARALYLAKLYPTPRIVEMTPTAGKIDTPTRVVIRGVHLPRAVRLLFNDRAAVSVDCYPSTGEIHATTPTGLEGPCRVVAVDSASGEPLQGELTFDFRTVQLPRPLHLHVDRPRMRQIRTERKLRQVDVSEAVGSKPSLISRFERGEWDPDDTLIERIAEFYGVSVEELLQTEEG